VDVVETDDGWPCVILVLTLMGTFNVQRSATFGSSLGTVLGTVTVLGPTVDRHGRNQRPRGCEKLLPF
jgi:hypothetical protein